MAQPQSVSNASLDRERHSVELPFDPPKVHHAQKGAGGTLHARKASRDAIVNHGLASVQMCLNVWAVVQMPRSGPMQRQSKVNGVLPPAPPTHFRAPSFVSNARCIWIAVWMA